MMEVLRFLEGKMDFGFFEIQGIPGMRMVVFSALLMMVILWYPRGLMGTNEFTWDFILEKRYLNWFKKKKTVSEEN
jgi:branched-chain amino acid transport system permease protein